MRWSYHIIHSGTQFCWILGVHIFACHCIFTSRCQKPSQTCKDESEECMTSIVIEKIHLMSVKIFVSYPFLLSSSLSFSCFDNCALSCRSCPSSLALDVSYLRKLCDGKNSLSRSLSLIKSIIVFDRKNPHYVCYKSFIFYSLLLSNNIFNLVENKKFRDYLSQSFKFSFTFHHLLMNNI